VCLYRARYEIAFRNAFVSVVALRDPNRILVSRVQTGMFMKDSFVYKCVPKFHSCHYPHLLAKNSSGEKRMFEFNIPTGFMNKAQGCGTPLPWVNVRQSPYPTLKGLRKSVLRNPSRVEADRVNAVWENRRNSVGVEKREGQASLTQGSGVPQPWAMIWNPVGILNTYVGISIPYPEGKDAGNDKSATWERVCVGDSWNGKI